MFFSGRRRRFATIPKMLRRWTKMIKNYSKMDAVKCFINGNFQWLWTFSNWLCYQIEQCSTCKLESSTIMRARISSRHTQTLLFYEHIRLRWKINIMCLSVSRALALSLLLYMSRCVENRWETVWSQDAPLSHIQMCINEEIKRHKHTRNCSFRSMAWSYF